MLAIYDENSPSSKNSNVIVTDPYKYKEAEASSSKLFIPVEQYKERRKKTHFVEVKNLDKRPCKLDFCVQIYYWKILAPDLQVETEHSQEDWQKTPSKYTLQKGGWHIYITWYMGYRNMDGDGDGNMSGLESQVSLPW